MASSTPLMGTDLIDCAKANAKQGIETAAYLCGYGKNLDNFKQNLVQACDNIGVQVYELSDLITDQQTVKESGGLEIAPETPSNL
ncbi:MAG TPA: hypothetical protein V6D28_27245 [Leptolyngbyaceae cyanobacterium]